MKLLCLDRLFLSCGISEDLTGFDKRKVGKRIQNY